MKLSTIQSRGSYRPRLSHSVVGGRSSRHPPHEENQRVLCSSHDPLTWNWPGAAKHLNLRSHYSESFDKTETKWFKSLSPHSKSPAEQPFGYIVWWLTFGVSQPPLAAWKNCGPTGPWRTGWKTPAHQRPHSKVSPGCRAAHHPSVPLRHTCMPRCWEKSCCHLTLAEAEILQKALQKKRNLFLYRTVQGHKAFPEAHIWESGV